MASKETNIKSSTVEKGLDLAKDFLGKLISPTIEEVGLLVSENVKYLRFKNQVRILLKAKNYVEKNNIKLKEIPIKILVPLLENASLESDESLQDKWANLLVNMVDSESNLQSNIFPYVLSQISIEEFNTMKELVTKEEVHSESKRLLRDLQMDDRFGFKSETKKQIEVINNLEQEGFFLSIEDFERANLLRLGLVRQLPPKIHIEEFSTGGDNAGETWHHIEAGYDPDDFGYRITELGQRFIEACECKKINSEGSNVT